MSDQPILFVDTLYWVALLNGRDEHHARVLRWNEFILKTGRTLVTTEAVFWETLNSLCSPMLRVRAAQGYRRCHDDPHVEIVGFASDLTAGALHLYADRPDKDWSMTDCLSFVVMEQRGIHEALTTDHHFEQAGFGALLRKEPPAV